MRGIVAAVLTLEAITVLLGLLVVAKLSGDAPGVGLAVVAGVGVAMIVAAGLQRRPYGLGLALALQVALLACGIFHVALLVMGVVFVLVWGLLLMLRRDVGRRLARGELPAQRAAGQS